MTKSKKRVLIIVIILFVIWTFVTVKFILTDKNSKEDVKLLGIESIQAYNKTNIGIGDSFYAKKEGKKLVVYDFNDKELYTYNDEFIDFEIFDKRLIIVKTKDKEIIINKNGTTLASGDVSKISSDNKYILIGDTIYNYNLQEIYKLDTPIKYSYSAYFINDLFIYEAINKSSESIIVDLSQKQLIWQDFSNYYQYYNITDAIYYGFTLNNVNYLLDTKTKQIVYENIKLDEDYYNVFTYKGYTYYIDDKIYGENTKISDKYIMSKDTCEDGYKLKDLSGKIIIDKCMNGYKVLFDNAIEGLDKKHNNILFYKDKEIKGAVFSQEGDYIKVDETYDLLGHGSKSTYYNKALEKQNIDEFTSLYYIGNGYYYGYDLENRNCQFYDKDLNKIDEAYYSITCYENTYCDVEASEYVHYLYKDGKKVTDEKLTNIEINDNEIILETLYKTYVLKLGYNSNITLDLSFDYNIDIDEIISKYDLKNDEFTINKNEELFTKYAYIVENNNNLLDYKKEVYNLFNVIIDNSSYLDEFYFLSKLGKLNILQEETLLDGKAAGTYEDYSTRVNLASNLASVVNHELIHFVDFSIHPNLGSAIYKCDGKYKIVPDTEYGLEACDYVSLNTTNYITEAGAEAFTAKYLTKEIRSYSFATNYFVGLEYIYGSEEIDKWYFEDVNNFYLSLLNDFESVETVNKILEALNSTTTLKSGPLYKTGYLLDVLIDLYKKHINNDYLSDKKFSFILKSMDGTSYINTSKYYTEFKKVLDMDYGSLNDLKKEAGYEYYSPRIDPVIIDDKMYLSWYAWNASNAENGIVWIDYDFDNDIVKDYYVRKEVYKVWE